MLTLFDLFSNQKALPAECSDVTSALRGKEIIDMRKFQQYYQFFAKKFLHVLVQSRSGEQICTHGCSVPVSSDTVGVAVDEIGELCAYLRFNFPSYPLLPNGLNLDFILHTIDGYDLPMESWRLEMNCTDKTETHAHTLPFLDLSSLLKSVISAAHVTPAFRYYALSQSENTYVFTYRVYEGVAEIDLGIDRKEITVGMVRTSYGSITVNLCYRTRMEYEEWMRFAVRVDRSLLKSDLLQVPDTSEPEIHSWATQLLTTNTLLLQRPRSNKYGCLKRKVPRVGNGLKYMDLLGRLPSEAFSTSFSRNHCAAKYTSSRPCSWKIAPSANLPSLKINRGFHGRGRISTDECKENRFYSDYSREMPSDELYFKHSHSEGFRDTWDFFHLCAQALSQNILFRANRVESLIVQLDHFKKMKHEFDHFVAEVTTQRSSD